MALRQALSQRQSASSLNALMSTLAGVEGKSPTLNPLGVAGIVFTARHGVMGTNKEPAGAVVGFCAGGVAGVATC